MNHFLLKVVLCNDDPSSTDISSHGLVGGIESRATYMCLWVSVDSDLQTSILPPSGQCVQERKGPIFFQCHSELDGRPNPVQVVEEFFCFAFLRMQKISSTYLFQSLGLDGAVSSAKSSM